MSKLFPISVAAGLLTACATPPPRPFAEPPPAPQTGCPVLGSSAWAAWVNAMPGPGARPTLIVTGKVTVPTGGWDFVWRDARVMESYPVQVAVTLEPLVPAGGATQAVTTREVRFEMPLQPPVGAVTVNCGGTVLARISPVETAH